MNFDGFLHWFLFNLGTTSRKKKHKNHDFWRVYGQKGARGPVPSSSTFAAHLPSTNWEAGNLNLILGTHSARREVCLLQNGCFKYCHVVNLKININKPLLRMVYYWVSFMKRKPITLGYCGVLLHCLKRPTKCVPVQSCDAVRP